MVKVKQMIRMRRLVSAKVFYSIVLEKMNHFTRLFFVTVAVSLEKIN